MLLLILFAGCLASCAAQIISAPFNGSTESILYEGFKESNPFDGFKESTLYDIRELLPNDRAILVSAVKSNRELNETTIGPVVEQQVRALIREFEPGAEFRIRVSKITKV